MLTPDGFLREKEQMLLPPEEFGLKHGSANVPRSGLPGKKKPKKSLPNLSSLG
jgi:hypothetical protein